MTVWQKQNNHDNSIIVDKMIINYSEVTPETASWAYKMGDEMLQVVHVNFRRKNKTHFFSIWETNLSYLQI